MVKNLFLIKIITWSALAKLPASHGDTESESVTGGPAGHSDRTVGIGGRAHHDLTPHAGSGWDPPAWDPVELSTPHLAS